MKKIETKSVVLLKHHLKSLRLPTVHEECEKVATRAADDHVDHLGFLLQLTELELIDRERRAKDRRIKAARFPTLKTLENFEFTAQPSLNKPLVLELARCEFLDRRENILMLGNPGTAGIAVQHVIVPPDTPQMLAVSGNGQMGLAGTELLQPLVVDVTEGDGSPFANKIVTFDITRSDGALSETPGGPAARTTSKKV